MNMTKGFGFCACYRCYIATILPPTIFFVKTRGKKKEKTTGDKAAKEGEIAK